MLSASFDCRVFSYVFLGIKLRLTDLKPFKPGLGTPQDVSLLKKAAGLNGQLNSVRCEEGQHCVTVAYPDANAECE